MPTYIMKCPHCGAVVKKTLMFDKNKKASGNSGRCNTCHNNIRWWGENGRAKIAKN